jgi:predicted  nucleic acid-binding Zn-ribbon protein
MRNLTYPKENQKKLNEVIRDLKALLRQKEKEIRFLRDELENLTKPVRDRKTHVEKDKLSQDEWRKDFIRRYKRDVLGEKG